MDSPAVETSLASVRKQVQSIMAQHHRAGTPLERVLVKRIKQPTPCWRITARMAGSYRWALKLLFTPHTVELGKNRIVLPEPDILMFTQAGLQDNRLTLCIVEAKRALVQADAAAAETTESLHAVAKGLERLTEPTRQIAATRVLRAVSKAIENSPIDSLAVVASAPTDVEVLVRALQQPDTIETMKFEDPLTPARLRGLRERERLLEMEGGTFTANQVARHLKVTRQAVNKRRQQGALVGLDAGRHGYLYPAWQFVRQGTIANLESVLSALKDHDAWMQHIFLVSGNTRLNGHTPLEVLREGRVNEVLKAARTFGEHGAA